MSSFSEYGFEHTSTNNRSLVSIDVTYADYEVTQEVFAMAERAKASTIENLTAKIQQVETLWEAARLAGIDARNAFQGHKQQELATRNDTQRANNALQNAIATVSNLRNTTLDVFASLQQREDHKRRIAEAAAKVAKCEADAITGNGLWQAYIQTAEQLATKWNQAQANFAERTEHLRMLKAQLAELVPDVQPDVATEAAAAYGLISQLLVSTLAAPAREYRRG